MITKLSRMGRLLHFLPMVLGCARFARESSANISLKRLHHMNIKTSRVAVIYFSLRKEELMTKYPVVHWVRMVNIIIYKYKY